MLAKWNGHMFVLALFYFDVLCFTQRKIHARIMLETTTGNAAQYDWKKNKLFFHIKTIWNQTLTEENTANDYNQSFKRIQQILWFIQLQTKMKLDINFVLGVILFRSHCTVLFHCNSYSIGRMNDQMRRTEMRKIFTKKKEQKQIATNRGSSLTLWKRCVRWSIGNTQPNTTLHVYSIDK